MPEAGGCGSPGRSPRVPFRPDYRVLSCSAQPLKLGETGLWNTPGLRAVYRFGQSYIEGRTMDAKTGANIKTGTITLGNKSYSFPVYDGTIGPEVLDVSKLYSEAGIFTYDPGFTSTGSCESKITYIDGEIGRAHV